MLLPTTHVGNTVFKSPRIRDALDVLDMQCDRGVLQKPQPTVLMAN